MPVWIVHDVTIVIISYFVGGFTTGYYLVKMREKVDLRDKGDGTLGARDVFKVMGPGGFIVVVLLDTLKGVGVAFVAQSISYEPYSAYAASAAVVAGHVFPAHLGFRGGKGVMTAIGTMLVLDPLLLAGLVGLMLPVLVVLRKIDLSGMIIVAFSPIIAFAVESGGPVVVLLVIYAVLIVWAHRTVLREELTHPNVD